MTNKQAMVTTLHVVAAAFDKKLTAPAVDAYWLALRDLTEQEFATATERALRECLKFMPSPAELRALARPTQPMAARSAAAWIAVCEAIRKHDYTVASIDFGPLTNTVLRAMGSWSWLCELGDEAMKWEAKRFAELFAAFASGPETALRPEPLEGWGRGRIGCAPVTVTIEGEIAPLDPGRAIEGPPSPMHALVRELAEAKSTAAPPTPIAVCYRCEWAASDCVCPEGPQTNKAAVPAREKKPPVTITEAEKAAALARMAAQLEARGGAA